MDERVMQFRVGVMVLATLMIAGILVLLFVGDLPRLTRGGYTIEIVFPQAPGVTHNTPVRKSGIRIGRVTGVKFSDNDKEVIVSAKIDGNRHIYHNEACRLTRSLVLGDVALEFAPNPSAPPTAQPTEIVGGEVIRGQMDQDLSESVTKLEPKLDRTMDSMIAAGNKLQATLDQLNRMLKDNETAISSVVQQADRTLATVQKTLENANDVVGDPKTRANLKTAIEELPGVLKDTRRTVGVLGDSITELQGAIGNVEKFTRPLSDRGDSMVSNLDNSLNKLSTLSDQLLTFSTSLNDPRSSLGQLVRDPELYQHVNRAARNLEELTRELKPIVSDARVFSDKIARHPEMLGVRGAIQKNPGIK
jgi:phospholipid/cholesterol/gamma-HCH transport system substrate-binding protein